MKAKHQAGIREDISWSENKDDYLPLRTGTAGKQIWSGFYTTRSNYKGLVKESASILGKFLHFRYKTKFFVKISSFEQLLH